jgi:hypothetical protein
MITCWKKQQRKLANVTDIREVTNPSDKITIDCTDMDAARVAVLLVGKGMYGIAGKDGLPLFVMFSVDYWIEKTYNMDTKTWFNSISFERIATALASMTLVGERTSMNDIVDLAHQMAARLRGNEHG